MTFRRRRRKGELFLRFALISLVPVPVLGLVLAATYRDEARRRGLASGTAQAHLVARTAVEPLLDDDPVGNGLSRPERAALSAMDLRARSQGEVLRLRLRSTTGRIVYSPDPADVGLGGRPCGIGRSSPTARTSKPTTEPATSGPRAALPHLAHRQPGHGLSVPGPTAGDGREPLVR